LLGDWNAHHHHWQSHHSPADDNQAGIDLYHYTQQHSLVVMNNMFQHTKGVATQLRGNVLDLIITNIPNAFTDCNIDNDPNNIKYHLFSDHYPVTVTANSNIVIDNTMCASSGTGHVRTGLHMN
jgi:endonuclease/exonuclease/phosphatase family metal-dependent hydrolase